MLVVAIRTLDQALINTMAERHIKLRLLLQVTRIAKVGLRLDQQLLFRCMVRRVAVDAAYIVLPVKRILVIEMIRPRSMAGQAAIIDHCRRRGFCAKIKDEFLCVGILRIGVLRRQFRVSVRFA